MKVSQIQKWQDEAADIWDRDYGSDHDKKRGARIFKNIAEICESKGRPHPRLGSWQDITYRTLSSKLDDFTDDKELSIRFLFWLAMYWDELYVERLVPKEFHVKYFRMPDVYGKMLCDVPRGVFRGTLFAGPILSFEKPLDDTLGYSASFTESAYAKERTVAFWSHQHYAIASDKLEWTNGLNDSDGCDVWDGCDPWLDIVMGPEADELRRRTEESNKRLRAKLASDSI